MKRLITIFICLFSFILQAKYYSATIVYEDGSVRNGYAELVNTKSKKVNFSISAKGKAEKISSEKLTRIIYTNEFGNSIIADRFYNNNIRNNNEIRKSKEKGWYYVYYSNELMIVGGNAVEIEKMFSKGEVTPGPEVSYYLGKKGLEDIYYLYYNSPKNLSALGGFVLDEQIIKISKQLFGSSCPVLITRLEEESFKFKDAIEKYIEIYNSTCN